MSYTSMYMTIYLIYPIMLNFQWDFQHQFSNSTSLSENNTCHDLSMSYKWFKDSPFLFLKAFDTDEVKQIVRNFIRSPPFNTLNQTPFMKAS